jgi:hypothetical protein
LKPYCALAHVRTYARGQQNILKNQEVLKKIFTVSLLLQNANIVVL